MGKTNKANRTKGNTRPSSSGQSAQLLNGRPLTGFIGFDALEKETPSYVPVTGQQISDSTDGSVDSDFRMVMRKMLKRDAITRLKAMQEFGDYCSEKDTADVTNVLRFWPRLFNRLALDIDRRIREATHTANGKLLEKVKRHIAPYLKNIMGVWLLGQCDLYPPSGSAAQAAFAKTFPDNKQSDVLMFCKTEIFAYLKDNLFEQTAKSMSEPNSVSDEDMENKYILVITATLQALKLFLTTIQPKELENIQEECKSIISNNKFWKLARHKEPQIRGSWFAVASCICNVKSSFFSGLEQKLATTVFSCLSESNPVVATSVWESALSIVVHLENCWEGIDINKVALPHLWSLISQGGKGNARVLYPCLLPFLSKLPKEVAESEEFLLKMFSSFKSSLKLDSIMQSPSECDAVLVALFECLQYICCVQLGSSTAGPDLLKTVLVNEIVPIIDSSLYDPKCNHLALSELYPLMTSLIRKIESQRLTLSGEISESYAKALNAFWEAMLATTYKYFTITVKEQEKSLTYMSYLFNCFLHQVEVVRSSSKKKKTVRFQEEEGNIEDDTPPPEETSPAAKPGISLSDKNTISFNHIKAFTATLCQRTSSDCNIRYLRLFEEIISSALTPDLAVALASEFAATHAYPPESAFGFFQNVMLKWVEVVDCEAEALSCVFRSIFVICSDADVEEAGRILSCCCKTNVSLLEQVLQKGLTSYKDHPFFKSWLSTSQWSDEVVGGLVELVKGKKFFLDASAELPIQIYYRILTMCLSHVGSELLLDDASFETIIQQLHSLVKQLVEMDPNHEIHLALNFIHDVTISILSNQEICWRFSATSDLVYYIFKTNLHEALHFKNSDHFSAVCNQILKAFVESYIPHQEEIMIEDSLIFKFCEELNASIQSVETPKHASHILQQSSFFIDCARKVITKQKAEDFSSYILNEMLDKVLPSEKFWKSLKKGMDIDTFHWFLKNKLFYPMLIRKDFAYPKGQAQKYSLVCEIVSCILTNATVNQTEDAHKFSVLCIENHLIHLLWFLTFCNGSGINEDNDNIKISELKSNCLKMISCLPEMEMKNLFHNIFSLSMTDMNWSLCFQYLGEICDVEISPALLVMSNNLDSETANENHALHRGFSQYLPLDVKTRFVHVLLRELSYTEAIDNEGYLIKLGELCCCLKSSHIEMSEDSTSLIKNIYLNVIKHDFSLKENKINMHYMLLISILTALVEHKLDICTKEIIDFLQNLLLTLTNNLKSKSFDTPGDLLLLNQGVVLFSALFSYQSFIENADLSKVLASRELHANMVFLFQRVADVFGKAKSSPSHKHVGTKEVCQIVLNNLLKTVNYLPPESLLNVLVSQYTETKDNPEKVQENETVIQTFISSLTSSVRPLQFASHMMLMNIMPLLPQLVNEEINKQIQSADDSEEEIKTPSELAPLIDLLSFLNEIVDSMLLGIKIGDLCTVIPHTDSHVYTMAYLLAWMQLFDFFSHTPSQICLGYALYLEDKLKLLSSLFANVLRLMPENPEMCVKKGLKVDTLRKEDLKLLFFQPPVFSSDAPTSEEIQSVACYVYALALRRVPAVIRTWFNNLDRKSSDIVNGFTTKYISRLLISEEMQTVISNEKLFENLAVQARPGSREVIATYTIDDCKIELCVQLPVNYPLGPITSERRGKTVIGEQEWRHWLMQLTTLLAYQNGSIIDGLNIWKKNLEKKFEGVEECMICYYILHSSTLKLPKLSCHVCRKKFHSACLYKWFHTSNNSTCPLCRNEFHLYI